GKGGARAYTRNNEYEVDPPTVPKPVDVTGAGDAFDAAFNVCIISGCDVLESLKFAVAAGAAKILKKGSSNMPDLHEILRMA
ncbi:MAG: PfkB family carbohydrate kinase, partial [Desulfurococcales archaeon]|nr:PfkB family carbohydrate kinase [Desulfurococcales archaeon]